MRALCDRFGSHRVAWGSDFPAMEGTMRSLVAFTESCLSALSAAERADFLGGTAATLYPSLTS